MAIQNVTEEPSVPRQTIEIIKEYAIVAYPLLSGIALLVLGLLFQATGNYIEAGVAAATGSIICLITVIVYVIFWALGRFGH